MKKLLEDGMSKETESKRRTPSVVARLMGLDGFPSQHNSNKQRKRNSNGSPQAAGSSGFRQSGKLCDGESHSKIAKGRQKFKDVYEVMVSSDMETRNNSFPGAFNWKPCEKEIAFIGQKFMDVKRFSTDEKLQHSKELHDALEVLDSNKDILLKFLQEPDSLFSKHLHKFHGGPESHCVHVMKMKSTNSLKCNIDSIGRQSGREASSKIDVSHSHKHRDSRNIDSQMNFLEDGKEVATSIPTRIVVLKPNLDKVVQSTARTVFSPSPSHVGASDVGLHSESSNIMHDGSKMRGKSSAPYEFDIYDRSRESRELAREITRRMRYNLGTDSVNVCSSGVHKGYSADESGRDMSENESSYDSEATTIRSQTSLNRSNRKNKASTSRYSESSLNREAKQRLSERWKMTRRSQFVGASRTGSTLAEMLANPDVGPDVVVAQDECFQRFGSNARMDPLGISSRDGWKDECIQSLSRSRSLPASYNHLGSPKSSRRHEILAAEEFLVCKESVRHLTKSAIKTGCRRKEVSFSGSAKSSYRRSKSFYPATMEIINDAQEVQSSTGMVRESLDGKDSFEVKAFSLERSSCRHDTSLALHTVVDEEHINTSESQNCSDQEVPAPEIPSNVLSQDNSSTSDLPSVQQEPSTNSDVRGSSCLQYVATQPESPVSSKESEQPSPVSVLETPFVEEISSGSECFERVSAELHGLRMQLQLLKLESEAHDEGLTLISSDEDDVLSSELQDCKGFLQVGESWESSYLVDVLKESKLNRTDPEFFLAAWHSPDCPIGLWVFENLEKKYGAWETCLRSERRFLFDFINSGIIEISRQLRRNFAFAAQWWNNGWFETKLHKFLENHEKRMTADAVILDGMQWLELEVHVDSIGTSIEGLLVDDLVTELLPV